MNIKPTKFEQVKKLHEKGFSAVEILDKIDISEGTLRSYLLMIQRGFNSPIESLTEFTKKNNFSSYSNYLDHMAKKQGFNSYHERTKSRIIKRGYKSVFQCIKQRSLINAQKPFNKNFSSLIQNKLNELNENNSWLANEIKVSRQSVSKYVKGETLPKPSVMMRIVKVLNLGYRTIQDLKADLS